MSSPRSDGVPSPAGGAGASPDEPDVPAAVLCAVCGAADCAGCEAPSFLPHAIPWEGRGGTALSRLWSTARLTSLEGEAFFGDLRTGGIASALLFATLCELFAIGSLLFVGIPVSYALVPEIVTALAMDPARRVSALVAVTLAVPALAALMVVLHVIWGGALELGVRLSGGAPRLSHGLRYALYACGWDLMTSPFGFVAASVTSGLRRAFPEVRAAMRVPSPATRAYLGRARGMGRARARVALVTAVLLTGAVVAASAIALGTALVVAMI